MNKEVLDFLTYCIGALSISLGISRNEVYSKLKTAGIVNDYIIPLYDVLHTFSRQYIVDDITDLMKKRGVLA